MPTSSGSDGVGSTCHETAPVDRRAWVALSVATLAGLLTTIEYGRPVDADSELSWVVALVALVAAGSILASIYNSMNERRREIAIMRALGARRSTVFAVVVLEASGIAALGALAGFGVYFVIMSVAAWFIRQETGIVLNPLEFQPVMAWAPLAMLGLGALAGLVPAAKAYRTDVAENLTPIS